MRKQVSWLASLLLSLLFVVHTATAAVQGEPVEYQAGDVLLKGFLAYDDSHEEKRPGVLVVHEWWGHNEYARERANMLAELGYVALAVDMYGDGQSTTHPKEAKAFMQSVMANKEVAEARFKAAMDTLQQHPAVDAEHIAAIGYCFGGAVVLEMARRGVDLAGVASFHGSLATDSPATAGDVKAKIMVFHGDDDALVPEESVEAFKAEMAAADANMVFVNYPGVQHSFTNPGADKVAEEHGLPLAYDQAADEDSWQKLQDFLNAVFGLAEIPEA